MGVLDLRLVWSFMLLPALTWGQQVLRVFILAGQSNMEGRGNIGNLQDLIQDPATRDDFTKFQNPNGGWRVRNDVTLVFNNYIGGLTVGHGATSTRFGPELGFGAVVGDYFNEPILLIKVAKGGSSLAIDWRPPSSFDPIATGQGDVCNGSPCTRNEYGVLFRSMVARVDDVISNLPLYLPQYLNLQPVISGFVWFQGFNDMLSDKFLNQYEVNLRNLMLDTRAAFNVLDMPFVIGELGMEGPYSKNKYHLAMREIQKRVADMDPFSSFVVTTRYVYPKLPAFDGEFHYFGRADTVVRIGQQFGHAVVQELFPTPTTAFPTFVPTNYPSYAPSSNQPSNFPSTINPSTTPSIPPTSLPTLVSGGCADNLTVAFYVPEVDECHTCIWLKARPNYQTKYCDPTYEFSAFDFCPETCNRCTNNLCDDDRDVTFSSGGHNAAALVTCVWLKPRKWYHPIYCNPGHPSGAFYLCEETCGSCSDNCRDTRGKFQFQGTSRDCAYLALRSRAQNEVCVPSHPAFNICPETCGKCDSLPTGSLSINTTRGVSGPDDIGRVCLGAPFKISPSTEPKPSSSFMLSLKPVDPTRTLTPPPSRPPPPTSRTSPSPTITKSSPPSDYPITPSPSSPTAPITRPPSRRSPVSR